MYVKFNETTTAELPSLKALWNDGEVMYYVGYPEGLGITDEETQKWLAMVATKPNTKHFSIIEEDLGFVGETFYSYREEGAPAIIDIKLLKKARGKGIAHIALGYVLDLLFRNTEAPSALVDPDTHNLAAINLYHKVGFVEDHRFTYKNREHVAMLLAKEVWRRQRRASMSLREITSGNYLEAVDLAVRADQMDFVALNSVSLVEAAYERGRMPRAIYAGENMVGFVLLSRNRHTGVFWISQLMIDQRFQGLGYGRRAMELALDVLYLMSEKPKICLSFAPTNIVAKNLYESLGFVSTGAYVNQEIIYEKDW